jgi:hypothetical protein
MLTITSAVQQLVSSSDLAIEGLQTGCLNMTAFAEKIQNDVEILAKKPVKKGSIVVALARLEKKYYQKHDGIEQFKLHNLVSRSGLTELTYPKTPSIQKSLANLYDLEEVKSAPFFVATTGLGEISIVTHHELASKIKTLLKTEMPALYLSELSSLTMQVAIETIDTPRQSYTVIKQLALRDITIVEYITSPTELTIILHDKDLKSAFNALHDKFFG